MAITNGYCTLPQLKARLDITDSDDDTIMELVIEAVSRAIDNECRRQFFTNTTATARYFTAQDTDYVSVDDFHTISTLKTDDDGDRTYEYTWSATDYDLMPYNADDTGWPYTWIEPAPDGDYVFTRMRKGVELTANWGWSAVPGPIREACLLQSERLFKRKDAPFGIAGSARAGGEMSVMQIPLDIDVKMLLQPYVRRTL